MGLAYTIKDRLEGNARQRQRLRQVGMARSRSQEIHLEYLRLEAQTFNEMLLELQNRRWTIFKNKKFSLMLSIFAMSVYVVGVFYMFKELDLSKVEQWQFAITALPFWLILVLIPMAIITFLTTRSTRS
ncbi:MAG: hypothetical protein E2O88_00530 [Bacteroidetes bacterium]|nr:MAG: hypothetical protein E2O88_00530 [Bacteroidota bacterium]